MEATAANMSKAPSRVAPYSKLTAVSSKPIGPGKIHPLYPLDHAVAFHTLHLVFYYKDNLFGSFDLDPLRESLSEVLSIYPAITGRLARGEDGNWEVRCNDAGVRVTKAKVCTTLHEWLKSADGFEERDLTAWEDMPGDPNAWSSFRIQINEFQGGGVAIGLSWSHMLADLISATSFFKSWTQAYRDLPISHPRFPDPALHPPPAPPPSLLPNSANNYAAKYSATKSQRSSSLKMSTATFNFSTSIIKQCLSLVHGTCDATPFDFLSALFWTRIARLKPSKNDQTHSLSICNDFRKILKEALPSGYFGNAMNFSVLSLKTEDILEKNQVADITAMIHRHMMGLQEEEIWSALDWLESQKVEGGKLREPTCIYGPELTCISMDQTLIYDDWVLGYNEKPAHVSCHVGNVDGEGLIVVMPSSEGGFARSVEVMLPEEELAGLCEDETILQLQPTMLLTGATRI